MKTPALSGGGGKQWSSLFLLDFGFFYQFLLVFDHLGLAHHFLKLRLYSIQSRAFDRTLVFHLNNVPAELTLYRLVGQGALLQAFHCLGKFGYIVRRRGPTQVTAIFAAARVNGMLAGGVLETDFLGLDLLEQVFSRFLIFDQDVTDFEFLAVALRLLDTVVLSLQLGVSDGVLVQIIRDQSTNQDALARQFEFLLDVGALVDAGLLSGVHRDQAMDHLLFDLLSQFRRVLSALLNQQGDELV